MELYPEQLFCCCAVFYLSFAELKTGYRKSFSDLLPLSKLITDGLRSPAEKDLGLCGGQQYEYDPVVHPRYEQGKAPAEEEHGQQTEECSCLCSPHVRPHQEDCALCHAPELTVCVRKWRQCRRKLERVTCEAS